MARSIPIYSPAPSWTPPRSRYIRVYHGCTAVDEYKIRKDGIDPRKGRVDTDFGRGFYTTTVKYQARQWAWARFYDPVVARIRPNRPVVLKFMLDLHSFSNLRTLRFILGGRTKASFWSLVQHCRSSSLPNPINHHEGPFTDRDGTCWYDLACGPVAAFWRQKYTMQDADQFSFHTPDAAKALQLLIDSGDKRLFDSEPVV